ncbi:MAG: DNA cytosine methyltransferase [Armatimonadetes bacterium]|nr:DNA cytosine methyltransferase [Armatimonadota bacterium]
MNERVLHKDQNREDDGVIAGPRSLELFSGGGGLALGLHDAGFEHVALVEFEAKACETLRHNARVWASQDGDRLPWTPDVVYEEDVSEFIRSEAFQSLGNIDLLAGGPPCQPFSLGGVHAGVSDRRNMLPVAMDFVRALRPRAVVFENVPGLLRPSFLPYFEYVEEQLRWSSCVPRSGESWSSHMRRLRSMKRAPLETRYHVTRQLINAADFGVPQTRQRLFLMAVRCDVADVPVAVLEGTHSRDALLYAQLVSGSYWAEHGLPAGSVPNGPTEREVASLRERDAPEALRWRTVRDAISGLPEPVEGQPARGVLNHVGIPGARAYVGHTGSHIDWPAKTLKAGVHGVCGGEAMIRFEDGGLRYLTVRESARIQTFPDEYEFLGARSHAMRHIGNAVAVKVAEAVGRQVMERLTR